MSFASYPLAYVRALADRINTLADDTGEAFRVSTSPIGDGLAYLVKVTTNPIGPDSREVLSEAAALEILLTLALSDEDATDPDSVRIRNEGAALP